MGPKPGAPAGVGIRALLAGGLAFLWIGAGCADDSPDAPDAAAVDAPPPMVDAEAPVPDPAAPRPPAEVSLEPCPPHWVKRSELAGFIVCDPAAAAPEECPLGEAAFLGASACEPVGDPCPAGVFPTVEAAALTSYVEPGAVDGNGSRERPFGSIAEAMGVPVNRIILAKGEFRETVFVDHSVEIIGACAAETRIVGEPPLRVQGGHLLLKNVSLHGSGNALILAHAAATLVGVHLAEFHLHAIDSVGSQLVLERVVMRPAEGTAQAGMSLSSGTTARIHNTVIERTRAAGILISGNATFVEIEDSVIRDIVGISVGFGRGIEVYASHLDVRRTLVDAATDTGIAAFDGAQVTARDVVVRNTRPASDNVAGRGIAVDRDSELLATRVWLADNRDLGVFAGSGSVDVKDLVVSGTRPLLLDGSSGISIAAQAGAVLLADRVHLEGGHSAGLLLDQGAEARLRDVTVHGVRPRMSDQSFGAGLMAQRHAVLSGERVAIGEVRYMGALLATATATLTDLRLQGIEAEGRTGRFGYGLAAQSTATVELRRVLIEELRGLGLGAFDHATLTGTDITVNDTRPLACGDSTCADAPLGFGLGSYSGAAVTATGFAIRRSSQCGIHLGPDGRLTPRAGAVEEAPIGLCLEAPYDAEELQAHISLTDTPQRLSATELPVPRVGTPLSDG